MELRPSEIFYSQDSILNTFRNNSGYGNTFIGETLDQLLTGHCNVNDIDRISVIDRNREWFTVDNRRLWVFRKAQEIGFLDTIPVWQTSNINPNKFTTKNGGTSIKIRGRDPGGYIWRTWEPPHLLQNYNLTKTNVFSSNFGYKTNSHATALNPNCHYSKDNGRTTIINVRQYSEANTQSPYRTTRTPSPVQEWNTNRDIHCISRHSSRGSPISFIGSNIRVQSTKTSFISSFESNTNRNNIQQFNLSHGSSYSRHSSRKSPISFIGSNITTNFPKTSFISRFGSDRNGHGIIQQFNVSQVNSYTGRSSSAQIHNSNTDDFYRINSSLSNTSTIYPSNNVAHRASFNSLTKNDRPGSNTSGMSNDATVTGSSVTGSRVSTETIKQEKPRFNYTNDLSNNSKSNIIGQDHSLTMEREQQYQGVSSTTAVSDNNRKVGCCSIL